MGSRCFTCRSGTEHFDIRSGDGDAPLRTLLFFVSAASSKIWIVAAAFFVCNNPLVKTVKLSPWKGPS